MLSVREMTTSSSRPSSPVRRVAALIRDFQDCIPLSRILSEGDLLILLTPVVPPIQPAPADSPGTGNDPFEPFGRALAKYHPWVRHVPYTARDGITSTHAGFIKRGKVVIFVVSGYSRPGQPSQLELSQIARAVGEQRSQIIVACCSMRELADADAIPTLVQISGYGPKALECAADLLFREQDVSGDETVAIDDDDRDDQPMDDAPSDSGPSDNDEQMDDEAMSLSSLPQPRWWAIEVWNGPRDMAAVHELWKATLPRKFHLDKVALQGLLLRDGWAMHYVVRDPDTKQLVGFCATFTNYVGSELERLIASLAIILVAESHRGQGIGRSLHDNALRDLSRPRGVWRYQLGSSFPRLLYGVPVANSQAVGWFRRRGWDMEGDVGGASGEVANDWFLDFKDWPSRPSILSSGGFVFRRCEIHEFDSVLEVVQKESARRDGMGWYDMYARLMGSMHIRDVVVGLVGGEVVATALTYSNGPGNPIALELPWAGSLAEDVGGVTCICITDDKPSVANARNGIMIRLLDACIQLLETQGKRKMLIDAVKGGEEGFHSMGFQKWESYRDVWRQA